MITKPKSHVFVPHSIGVVISAQRFMPQRIAEAIGRALGTDRVFTTDLQIDKRTAYARRGDILICVFYISCTFQNDCPAGNLEEVISNSYRVGGADLIA